MKQLHLGHILFLGMTICLLAGCQTHIPEEHPSHESSDWTLRLLGQEIISQTSATTRRMKETPSPAIEPSSTFVAHVKILRVETCSNARSHAGMGTSTPLLPPKLELRAPLPSNFLDAGPAPSDYPAWPDNSSDAAYPIN